MLPLTNNSLCGTSGFFIDDGITPGNYNEYGQLLGGSDFLNQWQEKVAVAIAIGNPAIIKKIVNQVNNPNVWFPNLIAPNVLYFDENNVTIGHGNLLTFSCRLSCHVTIGNFNLLNGQVSLGHDVTLGDYNVMMPETRISGESTIGNSNFFGARSLVLQGLKIGNYTRIGASSVIMRNTKDGVTYFGNPAKTIEHG